MKFSKYRAIGGSFLVLSLFLSMVLIGCTDETFTINQNGGIEEGNFKILIKGCGPTSSTRASSNEVDDTEESKEVDGTEDENYIDIDGEDYRIYIFGKSGKCHDEIRMKYTANGSNPAEGIYCFSGNLPYENEDLREIQVVFLANATKWVDNGVNPYPDVVDIADLRTKELVFNYKKRIAKTTDATDTADAADDADGEDAADDKFYSWQPNKVKHDGIPMAGVSNKIPISDDPKKINEVSLNLVRALSKIEVWNSDLYSNGHSRMYVKKTGCSWVEVYLYEWHTENWEPKEILGRWPGSAPTGVMTINEAEYYYWDLGENNGKTHNFIFNNNNKGIQMDGPQNVVLNRDFYVEIVNNDNWTVSKEFVHDGYTVFINKKNIDLENVHLYIGGDNEIMGSRPGRTPTGIRRFVDNQGEKYYYFWDLGTEYEGTKAHFEFSGGNDATKLPDIKKDYTIQNGKHQFFYLDYQAGGVKVEKSTITVTKPENWDELYVYEYNKSSNEKIFGEWPGAPMTETVTKTIGDTETTFYQKVIDGQLPDGRSKVGLDAYLIFNDGAGRQLSDHHYNTKDNLFLNLSDGYFHVEKVDYNAEHFKHRVYIKDPGWENLYVYNWGAGDFFGEWPGKKLQVKKNIDGVDYYMFDVNPESVENGIEFNLIFNNNNGTQTEGNYHLRTENYLEIIDNQVEPEEKHQDKTGLNLVKHYKVFVNNDESAWGDNINLYMWGDINDLGGGWPGMKTKGPIKPYETDENSVDREKVYYYFDLESSWTGLTENIILNSPPVQMADYNFTINGDLYISMLESITDISNLTVTPDVVNIYVKDNIKWSEGLYLYTFNSETLGGWPGLQGTLIQDGVYKGYYQFQIEGYFGKSTTLIFHNNNGTKLNDFEVKLNGDLFLTIGDEFKELKETEETIVVEAPESPDNINSIALLEYNTTGLLLPSTVISAPENWWDNYNGTKLPGEVKTNRKEDSEEMYNLYFVQSKTPGIWVCYVPEWNYGDNSDYDDPLNSGGLNLLFNIKNYQGQGTKKENDPQYKKEDDDSYTIIAPLKISNDSFKTLLRNNLYIFPVNINTDFEIIYTICPWDKQTSGDIEFK